MARTTPTLELPPGTKIGRTVGEALAAIERAAPRKPSTAECLDSIDRAGRSSIPPRRPKRTPITERARTRIVLEIPGLVVVSEPNVGKTLRARIQRKNKLKAALAGILPDRWSLPLESPVKVRLVRVGGRRMDAHDNLPAAFKAVVDAIADWLGVDDGDADRVRWSYAQRPGYWAGIRVEVG